MSVLGQEHEIKKEKEGDQLWFGRGLGDKPKDKTPHVDLFWIQIPAKQPQNKKTLLRQTGTFDYRLDIRSPRGLWFIL